MNLEILGTVCFGLAVLHTFFVSAIAKVAHRHHGRPLGVFLHALSEVELVFAFWAALFLLLFAFSEGPSHVAAYVSTVKFTEPLFVFTIMLVSSSRPVLSLCRTLLLLASRSIRRLFKASEVAAELFTILAFGSLAGSLITEPAAMTVAAIFLRSMIRSTNQRLLYAMIGVLFVNISIGGALTPFAAPPILMVAHSWGWDLPYVFLHIGWKAMVAVLLNSFFFVTAFRSSLHTAFIPLTRAEKVESPIPWFVLVLHLIFLGVIVVYAHDDLIFLALLAAFLVLYMLTRNFQEKLKWKESGLVGVFLAGIVLLGPFQAWWVTPLIENLSTGALFLGAAALTSLTDNAALTFLGSQIPTLTEPMKNALVEGALAGGGLTIIANAPNPAGVAMLREKFPDAQVNALGLFLGSLIPTVIAICCFWFLPFLV